jgi:DNA (cytosine-5)-methyltransferase 1
MIFKLGELFCGPGGLACGAIKARVKDRNGKEYRIKHVFANDIDPDACKTYEINIANGNGIHIYTADIRKFDLNKLPSIDILAFGFPCNDFSLVGEQKGINGKYGPLYSYGCKVLNIKKPKCFIAENVGGLRSADGGKTFKKILEDLSISGNGYRLTVHLYKFEEYNVPQKRHRILIVGIDKSLGFKFEVPYPTTKNNYISAQEAIENPPISTDASNNEFTKQSETVIKRLSYIPEGCNAWSSKIPPELRLNVKKAKLSQIYRRLKANEPAYTITGSGGGGTHVYHWKENRALTNRERARLQTFPDNFIFSGSKESVRKQIGMAVPPEGAKIIFKAVLKTFAGIPYKSVKPHWEDIFKDKENK